MEKELPNQVDVAVVGSGMAGLSAALYAGRYELSTLVIGELFGGATSTAWTIENFPGHKAIDGYDLMMKVKDQVEELGCQILTDKVEKIDKDNDLFILHTVGGKVIRAKTVVLGVGAERRKLNIPKEAEFSKGKGVHYCTTCDGPLYKGKTIGIIGGGDASVKGMNLAVQYADKIVAFVMGDKLIAEPINYARLQPHIGKKVEIKFKTKVAEILGTDRLTGVKTDSGEEIKLDGLFIEIGAVPAVEIVKELGVKLDDHGYLEVNNMMETSVPGLYAAGDTTNFFGHFKQDITAAAMGAVAATSAFTYLQSPKS